MWFGNVWSKVSRKCELAYLKQITRAFGISSSLTRSLFLEENVDSVELHVVRDHALHVGCVQSSLELGFGQRLNNQIVLVVGVVVVVELQNVAQGILRVLKRLADVVEVELLHTLEDVSRHLCALIGERGTVVDGLDWSFGGKLAEKLVRVNANAVFLGQLLEDSALVEALVDHLHHGGVLLLANLTPCELVQHVGKSVEDAFEAEDLVLTLSVDRTWIIVDFFKASRVSESLDQHALEVADKLRFVDSVVSVDQDGELQG